MGGCRVSGKKELFAALVAGGLRRFPATTHLEVSQPELPALLGGLSQPPGFLSATNTKDVKFPDPWALDTTCIIRDKLPCAVLKTPAFPLFTFLRLFSGLKHCNCCEQLPIHNIRQEDKKNIATAAHILAQKSRSEETWTQPTFKEKDQSPRLHFAPHRTPRHRSNPSPPRPSSPPPPSAAPSTSAPSPPDPPSTCSAARVEAHLHENKRWVKNTAKLYGDALV